MPRYTLVFGNGLGMAMDDQYFSLGSGLKSVWNGSENFGQEQKRLMVSAINGLSVNDFPKSEEQLDQLQVAIVASEFLRNFESDEVKWLSDMSRGFPEAFRRFVHEVASYFHDSGKTLPDAFVMPLSAFIKETKSHVAVLNYDNLLYDAFNNTDVLSGYRGALIDGFLRAGFDKENLDRYNPKKLGWYLHLHGSPLFIGNRKLMGDERLFLRPDEKSHIVLTHVEHKPLVIASSLILSEYWSRLPKALKEAGKIIIFGYSGCDTHLNEIITTSCPDKDIYIIEWEGSGEIDERTIYWSERLSGCRNIQIRHIGNLLDFNDWFNLE